MEDAPGPATNSGPRSGPFTGAPDGGAYSGPERRQRLPLSAFSTLFLTQNIAQDIFQEAPQAVPLEAVSSAAPAGHHEKAADAYRKAHLSAAGNEHVFFEPVLDTHLDFSV